MERETILSKRVNSNLAKGYVVHEYVDGIASYDIRSKSGRIIRRLKKKLGDVNVIIVIGAKRRYATEGTKNAIMYKPTQQAK